MLRSCSCYYSSSAVSAAATEAERTLREGPRNDWTRHQIDFIYHYPLLDLLFHGAQVHRHGHNFREVQQCTIPADMGMEVCCTLGMLEKQQALELKKAGLTAYNHNLDTSKEYYPNIITTRTYDERLETLQHVREAGINVCSGGIIGLGEAEEDRVGLLHTLATLPTHPESVPINALVAVEGTPLQDQKPVEIWEMIWMIATARIVMPTSMDSCQLGEFVSPCLSRHCVSLLLTTPNNDYDADQDMFKILGLIPKPPSFPEEEATCDEAVSTSG
ncbi:Biotin synthase [Hibiscus syriacus]|uniref:biotin synthase n=1 Tax=Hibiscus syriacus TaxID=106335 RepID=A0A6A3CNT7_HIBSY|nr:Biotin synthase [Hibiscus syriacus]